MFNKFSDKVLDEVGSGGGGTPGLPVGGSAGQVLSKIDAADYNVEWTTPGGGGSFSIPIYMRAIPTITLGDAAAFTTTGTTKDVLILPVNSSGDAGLHTVYLDAEL